MTPSDVAAKQARMPHKARSKYGATPTTIDGIRFHSAKESRRYSELKLLEKAGEIRDLKLQPKFALLVQRLGEWSGGEPLQQIGLYIADFQYLEWRIGAWLHVVEDVKGVKTALYRWKVKHFLAQYLGIDFREL